MANGNGKSWPKYAVYVSIAALILTSLTFVASTSVKAGKMEQVVEHNTEAIKILTEEKADSDIVNERLTAIQDDVADMKGMVRELYRNQIQKHN